MKRSIMVVAALAAGLTLSTGCSDEGGAKPKDSNEIDFPAAFVVVSGDNTIAVIDIENDRVDRTIPLGVGSWPHHVNLSPDGMTLTIGMPGMDLSEGHEGGMMGMEGRVVMMDARTLERRGSLEMEGMVHNAVHSPDGTEIWTAVMMDSTTGMNAVHVYSEDLGTHIAEIPVGSVPQEVTFSMDGRHAFVCNGESGTVTMIDVATKEVEVTIPVGAWPVGAWPGVDGLMYVDNEDSGSLSVIDPALGAVAAMIELGFSPGYVATPAAVGEIWVTDPVGAKVHFYDRATRSHLGLFDVGAGAHAIAFSDNGAAAYVTCIGAGTVSVVSVAGHAVQKTLTVGTKPNGIAVRVP